HRVAVLDFNYANVLVSSQTLFGSNQNIGRELANMLADRLVNDGTVRIVERNAINKVLSDPTPPHDERDNNSGLANHDSSDNTNRPNSSNQPVLSAPVSNKVGRVLGVDAVIQYFGVDAIITGEITQFGRDDDTNGGGMLGSLHKKSNPQKGKAVVGITAHMVDVSTGEILVSVNIKTESIHANSNLLKVASSTVFVPTMNSASFPRTILGEAVIQAVDQLALAFEQKYSTLPAVEPVSVSGLVADVSATDVTINIGSMDHVHVGDTLLVTRAGRIIRDPTTGNIIRSTEDTIGQITITSVDIYSSVGHFSGGGKIAVNDTVKNMPKHN
ncbi:MAG: CsgG/HfaB family protein, partial [Acidobacteriaceae bacterium]|nr:CsgG/HfaB family protein [Acidobacteriaceae bacterium]